MINLDIKNLSRQSQEPGISGAAREHAEQDHSESETQAAEQRKLKTFRVWVVEKSENAYLVEAGNAEDARDKFLDGKATHREEFLQSQLPVITEIEEVVE